MACEGISENRANNIQSKNISHSHRKTDITSCDVVEPCTVSAAGLQMHP